jgi:ribosome biogenesis GTPase / thiamine phosphate phosphatase
VSERDQWVRVRIAAEHRGAYQAQGDGGAAWVELTGKTFHRAEDKRDLPTVGDWVLVENWPDALAGKGAAIVRELLPRTSFLVRKAAGTATTPQPLAANVDVGIVMTSANADLVPARLDRYVSLLRDGGIEPVIAVSKIDLVPDPEPLLAAVRAVGPRAIAVSVVTGTGLDEIRALGGPGRTCVVLGSSGVGKSSLLNAILGTQLETRAIRADERGVHTTTRRELFVAPDGGAWLDTPGMRELAQWIDEDEEAAFDDIAELAQSCKFRDCHHRDEPGCAVRDAVPAERLASFHKLGDERARAAAKQSQAKKLGESRKARAKKAPPSGE